MPASEEHRVVSSAVEGLPVKNPGRWCSRGFTALAEWQMTGLLKSGEKTRWALFPPPNHKLPAQPFAFSANWEAGACGTTLSRNATDACKNNHCGSEFGFNLQLSLHLLLCLHQNPPSSSVRPSRDTWFKTPPATALVPRETDDLIKII